MVDKNLFLYDLAIVAIFKDEGHYLKEWLDYHLLAGVEHFYLYNNDSTDDYKEILAPYVEANLVTLTDFPGKTMQMSAYEDAIDKYRFDCRYMAFIDLDEFIYPKTYRPIIEVVDEILSGIPNAAGLGINWQCFGSNGQEKADYSRGVLERFTRRAEKNFGRYKVVNNTPMAIGNIFLKLLANPRRIKKMLIHHAIYFEGNYLVNENGLKIPSDQIDKPVLANKIAINHYFTKSREEFDSKRAKGRADYDVKWTENYFERYDCNEEFDDGILKYRDARAEKFSSADDNVRINRVINNLVRTLTAPEENFETFLTCRAVAEKFQIKIADNLAEEYALAWIYRTLKFVKLTPADVQMFLRALPEILSRPFPICKDIKILTQDNLLPQLYKLTPDAAGINMLTLQKLLRLIK